MSNKVKFGEFMKVLRDAKVVTREGSFTKEFIEELFSHKNAESSAVKIALFSMTIGKEPTLDDIKQMYVMDVLINYSSIFYNMNTEDVVRVAFIINGVLDSVKEKVDKKER